MKLWATRDSEDGVVELWNDKPEDYSAGGSHHWVASGEVGGSKYFMSQELFRARYKHLPRRDRPMRVTMTGTVPR